MTYQASTYALAWEALRLYRAEMRDFVVTKLREHYGDLWMAQGVERLFPVDQIENLKRILGQRQRAGIVDAAAESMEDMLDVSHFRNIIEGNWKPVFEKALGDKTILDSWVAEVTTARNALAHWSGGDMPRKDAMRIVDTCERVIRSFNPERAEAVQAIWDDLDARSSEQPDTQRATVVFEDGTAPLRATIIFDEPKAQKHAGPSAIDKARIKHPRAYEPWTPKEETKVLTLARSGQTMNAIAATLGRQPSAIKSRLIRLGWDGVQD